MRCRCRLLLVLSMMALVSCQRVARHEFPDDWDIHAIADAVPRDAEDASGSPTETYVLAWKVRQVDRRLATREEGWDNRQTAADREVRQSEGPVTLEECLVLKRFGPTEGRQRWALAAVYRHPPAGWQQFEIVATSQEGHAHVVHRRSFIKCPTNWEVYDFIDTHRWKLGAADGWRLLRGEVCRRTWKQVIGEEPTRFFENQR